MKNRLIIVVLLIIAGCSLHAQSFLLKKIKDCIPECESKIKRKILLTEKKEGAERYSHILFIPFLYLNNVDLTQDLINSDSVETVVMNALKERPTSENLRVPDKFPHYAIVYDDSLTVLVDDYYWLCTSPAHSDVLLKYFVAEQGQLLFYIWGNTSLFMMVDNKIYILAYNKDTNSFSKVDL